MDDDRSEKLDEAEGVGCAMCDVCLLHIAICAL